MYVITGITGQVGGVVARELLSKNQSVRAVVRDANKGTVWAEQGCAVTLADMNDADALKTAFADAKGVFVLIPPNFAPSRGFPETRAIVAALHTAIAAVPRDTWSALFKAQGTADPQPRIRMLDGFNEGWIEFESGESGSIKCEVELETVLKSLVGHGPTTDAPESL